VTIFEIDVITILQPQERYMTENSQSAGKNEFFIYLAAFIDADGCVSIHKQPSTGGKTNYVPHVGISSTCKKTVEYLDRKFKECEYGHYITFRKVTNPNWTDRYVLEVRGMLRCKKLLEDIQEYMVTKQDEARLVLEFIRLRQSHSKMVPYSEEEMECITKVKLAKKTR
jgi:hypothetical protein